MASDIRRIFHLSDIHFGLENNRALDWVKQEIAEKQPDAVAITGDLTMRARHREFAAATQWINSLDAPVTVEVGNHDMPYFNLIERFFSPYERFRGMKEKVERELDLGALAIVPLKTAVRMQPRLNWSKGWVSQRALDRCLAALDALHPHGAREGGDLPGGRAVAFPREALHVVMPHLMPALLRREHQREAGIARDFHALDRVHLEGGFEWHIRLSPFVLSLSKGEQASRWKFAVRQAHHER